MWCVMDVCDGGGGVDGEGGGEGGEERGGGRGDEAVGTGEIVCMGGIL